MLPAIIIAIASLVCACIFAYMKDEVFAIALCITIGVFASVFAALISR